MARGISDDNSGLLWVEEGEAREGMVADVAPLIPVHRSFSFAVPEAMENELEVGRRVVVPIGRAGRSVQGFVLGVDRRVWDSTLRPIESVVDQASYLTEDLVELGRRIAKHYACPLGRTLKAITPEAVRRASGLKTVRYAEPATSLDEILASDRRLSPKRRRILEVLDESGGPSPVEELLERAGASSAVLREMAKLGWVRITKRKELIGAVEEDQPVVNPDFELNEEQRSALDQINEIVDAERFRATLLFGVSGSGKTEVYIRAMQRVIAMGKQAILLVPEIVLTTQLVQRLIPRFPNVAVNHSGLSDSQRSIIWRRTASGEKQVVIGTRSAVFAPCPNLGLICVDEEQETSYKNLQAPRFHVRDVAIMRAQQLGIPVVLGSATPSVETWYNSEHRPHYQRVYLRRRVKDLPMPKVRVVDMRDEWRERKTRVVLSSAMERLLSETLRRKEQGVILINRRGFANRVMCPSCGMHLQCPNCNVSLVVHVASRKAICHYCGRGITTPKICPNIGCGGRLVRVGAGTERVEEVLRSRFPAAVIRRVDSDTMRHRDHYQQVVDDFESRKIDLLVGTQMIAKGLDFPFVSFVGVITADTAAVATDFRAQESLFQLMTQVAGRAGRANTGGVVVIQTMMPETPALRFAVKHDYESFVAGEIDARRRVSFPPFRRLARIVLAHKREESVREESEELADRVGEAIRATELEYADVLGPTPCPLARLRGQYRYDLLIRTRSASDMHRLLDHLRESGGLRNKAQATLIDVDPVSLA